MIPDRVESELRVKKGILLIDRRVGDRHVVDGAAAVGRRDAGQHANDIRISDGDQDRFVQRDRLRCAIIRFD